MALAAAGTAAWSAAGAFWGAGSSGNSVLGRCRSVLWPWQQRQQRYGALQERSGALEQQKQRSGALQERSGALAAAGTAFWSTTGAFCGPDSSRNSVLERCRSVLGP